MARWSLHVPLDVLVEQLRAVRHMLLHEEAIAAFVEVGQDATAYAAEAERTADAGERASLALGIAHDDQAFLTAERAAWREAYAAWAANVRLDLDESGPFPEKTVKELKRRLGRYPGRTFAGSRDSLERALVSLQSHAQVLRLPTWHEEPLGPGEHLRARGDELATLSAAADDALSQRSDEAAGARAELQDVIRTIQGKWRLARAKTPSLPELRLEVVGRYTPTPRKVGPKSAKRDLVALTSDVGALTSDVGALTSDVGALTSDVGALTSDVGALTSDVGGVTRIFVGVQVREGTEVAGERTEVAGEGTEVAGEGTEVACERTEVAREGADVARE